MRFALLHNVAAVEEATNWRYEKKRISFFSYILLKKNSAYLQWKFLNGKEDLTATLDALTINEIKMNSFILFRFLCFVRFCTISISDLQLFFRVPFPIPSSAFLLKILTHPALHAFAFLAVWCVF